MQKFSIDEILDAYEKEGSYRGAARLLGLAESSVRRRIKNQKDAGLIAAGDELGFDADKVNLYWVKSKSGSYLVNNRQEETDEISIAETMRHAFEEFKPMPLLQPTKKNSEDGLTIYPIVDAHHGMLAWGQETGTEWNIQKSIETYQQFYAELISKSSPTNEAWIINLGDFFHSNDSFNATPQSKNLLDVDSRYDKMVFSGTQMFKSVIDMAAQKHDKIKVINLKGNHDPDSSTHLSIGMHYAYENNPNVEVNLSPKEHYYGEFGKFMLGANHGHRTKPDNLAMHMAGENPDMWGRTKYRLYIKGHFHHEMVKEVMNVRVETFQTLTPKDAHASLGSYMSGRSVSSIEVDREKGECGRIKINV